MSCGEVLLYVLLAVQEADFDAVFVAEVLGEMLCGIDAAMLPTGATKGHHEVGKTSALVGLYVEVDQSIYAVEETLDFAVVFEEADDGFVQAGELLVGLVSAGVVRAAAVEDVATAVAVGVGRNAAFVGETEHADHERAAGVVVFREIGRHWAGEIKG